MHLSHQIKLNPTKAQEVLLRKSCGVARKSFNWGLNKWNEMYMNNEQPSAFTLIKFQNSIKKEEFPYFSEVSKNAPQYALHDLNDAWKHYFRKLKSGEIEKEKAAYIKKRLSKGLVVNENKLQDYGKPKFKKKGVDTDSFIAVENKEQFKQKDKKIRLPRIGWVKCAEDLRFKGKVNNVTIKRIADMWFAVISIEIESPIKAPIASDNQATIGVDVGIKMMLVLSDGTAFENPRALKSNLKGLKRLQKGLFRKVKGSNNRYKNQMRIARKHYRISNIRKNAIHQATTFIVNNYDKIVIEDLNVSGMVRNHNLAQAISDVSFGEMRRQLAYKALWQGKELVVADRFFASSKLCSCCGNKKDTLTLSERIYKCENCGLSIDRDLNAANNLAAYRPTPKFGGSEACGESSVRASMKQEVKLVLTT